MGNNIPEHYTVKDSFYDKILTGMKSNSKEREFLTFISKYRDQNIDWLANPILINRQPLFSDKLRTDLCKIFGITLLDIEKAAKEVPRPGDLDNSAKPSMNGFNCFLLLIMKYYLDMGHKSRFEMVCFLYGLSSYPSVWSKYFGNTRIHEPTMVYTVDNMIGKFILKQTGSVEGYIKHNMIEASSYYGKIIQRASDEDLIAVTSNLQTRLNNSMNKIKHEYEKNRAAQKATFVDRDFNEEGDYISRDGTLGEIDSLAQAYTTKFLSGVISDRLVILCSKEMGISSHELRNTLQLMQNQNRNEEVYEFYSAIFYLFLNGDYNVTSKDIKTIKFPVVMEQIYKKGHSKDKNIIKIKDLMNQWLTEGSLSYARTKRLPTQQSFRKAIYSYLTFAVSA